MLLDLALNITSPHPLKLLGIHVYLTLVGKGRGYYIYFRFCILNIVRIET